MRDRFTIVAPLRALAYEDASELERSRVRLAELAALVQAHYVRRLEDVLDEDGQVVERAGDLQRIGTQEIRAWWLRHRGEVLEMHQAMAEGHLAGIGVQP